MQKTTVPSTLSLPDRLARGEGSSYGLELADVPALLASATPFKDKDGGDVEATYLLPEHGLLVKARRRYRLLRSVRREFELGRWLAARGVPVVPPIGYLETRGETPTDYLVLPLLPNADNLRETLVRTNGRRLSQILDELGRLVARLHDTGYVHGDLTLKNVIGNPGPLLLIDLDHARRVPPPLRLAYRIHDLRDLRVSARRIPELRFERVFDAYADARGLSRAARRLYWRTLHWFSKRRERRPAGWGKRRD